MNKHLRRGPIALLVILLALVAAGCMPAGGITNPGWTVVAAAGEEVWAVLATGQVVALKAQTGDVLWQFPQKTSSGGVGCGLARPASDPEQKLLDAVYGPPAVTDDLILVASYDQHLYAFERATGRKVWSFAAQGAIIGGPAVYEGTVYFGSSDRHVYAVELTTGRPVWDAPFETGNWVWSTPAVDAERVYVGSMDHYVYALNRLTGVLVWKRDVGGSVPGSAALAEGALYVGGVDKQLHALRAEDGQELWARPVGHWVMGEPLVHKGIVYVATLDGKVHALKATDGAPAWEPVALGSAVRAGPVLWQDKLIVVTESGVVHRVSTQTGERETFFSTTDKDKMLALPALNGDLLYVGTTLGNIYALDLNARGNPQLWVYPPKKQ